MTPPSGLDHLIIEEIKKREEEKRRREEIQPTVPADDPREIPERRDDRQPNPGYEMPSPNDPKRDERPKDKDESGRGVTVIDIGGGGDAEEKDDPNTMDISKILETPSDEEKDKDEKRPD